MAPLRVEAVDAFRASLDEILAQAQTIKKADTIEPPILKTDVADFLEKVRGVDYLAKNEASKKANQYAIIETAVRDVFIGLVVSIARPHKSTSLTSCIGPSFDRLSWLCPCVELV
jgi:THO complex subunit 1